MTLTLASMLLCSALAVQEREISGRVVDADDNPVAGAELGKLWKAEKGVMTPYSGFKTDEDGKFTGKIRYYGSPVGLTAMDADRKRGASVILDEKNIDDFITLTVEPLVRVHGAFKSTGLGEPIPWTNVYLSAMPGRVRLAMCMSQEAAFDLRMPPGEYQFWAYGTDVKREIRAMTLASDNPDMDLKTIDLDPTIIAQHYGKPPPSLNITDARGVDKDMTLADFKGKWVLIEFWGYW